MESYLGAIMLFGGSYAPEGWVPADGRSLKIGEYQALYSLYGTRYGGDGVNTFNVPDLRGRFVVGATTTTNIGPTGGAEQAALTSMNIPVHTHTAALSSNASGTYKTSSAAGTSNDPSTGRLGTMTGTQIYAAGPGTQAIVTKQVPYNVSVGNTGIAGMSIDTRPPYLGMTFLICTQGLYPTNY
jgi:microcystin-dependent protein